jgi:hypothetical protein
MAMQPEGQWVVPNPQIPRTFGIMNIVFGGILLLFGVGSLVATLYGPKIQKWMFRNVEKTAAAEKAEQKAKIADLKRQEAAAKTEKDKDALKAEREDLEKSVAADITTEMDDLANWNPTSDIRIAVYTYSAEAAGILLNVLMIVAGIGLLRLSEPARKLAIWVAWLKIARWIALTIVTMVLILPITMERTQKIFDKVQAQQKAQSGGRVVFPMGGFAQMMAVVGAISQIFYLVIASIYPALVIWFLTRPRTRAACLRNPAKLPELDFELGGTG